MRSVKNVLGDFLRGCKKIIVAFVMIPVVLWHYSPFFKNMTLLAALVVPAIVIGSYGYKDVALGVFVFELVGGLFYALILIGREDRLEDDEDKSGGGRR